MVKLVKPTPQQLGTEQIRQLLRQWYENHSQLVERLRTQEVPYFGMHGTLFALKKRLCTSFQN